MTEELATIGHPEIPLALTGLSRFVTLGNEKQGQPNRLDIHFGSSEKTLLVL